MSLFNPLLELYAEQERPDYHSEFATFEEHLEELKRELILEEKDYLRRLAHGASLLSEHFKGGA